MTTKMRLYARLLGKLGQDAAAMLVDSYVLAKLVHFGFGLLVLYGIRVACRAFGAAESAWLAMPLFLFRHGQLDVRSG